MDARFLEPQALKVEAEHFFDQSSSKDFECAICLNIMDVDNIQSTPCAHLFCKG